MGGINGRKLKSWVVVVFVWCLFLFWPGEVWGGCGGSFKCYLKDLSTGECTLNESDKYYWLSGNCRGVCHIWGYLLYSRGKTHPDMGDTTGIPKDPSFFNQRC